MSLKDISDEFNDDVERLFIERINRAMVAAMDVTALAKTRIINLRVNEFGVSFGEYKDSTWRQKKAKREDNRNINFVETTRMMTTTLPHVAEVTPDTITMIIDPKDDQRNEVFYYHQDRFGPLIVLNAEETAMFLDIYGDATLNDINF